MELHDARRASRVDPVGDIVPLDVQDRARWDRARIERAAARLDDAVARGRPGPYQLQAAIAACHAVAADADDTDWAQIALLYGRLRQFVPSPVVELNRAVAVAMADGPAAGLPIIESLVGRRCPPRLPPAAGGACRPAAPPRALGRGGRRLSGGRGDWSPTTPNAASSNAASTRC